MSNDKPTCICCEEYGDNPHCSKCHTHLSAHLTKRELFAAMAMQGLLSCGPANPPLKENVEGAVRIADALLAELTKGSR